MMLNRKGSVFSKFLAPLSLLLLIIGCAVQQKPQGGPRDTQAPKLLKAEPANMTKRFSSKEIKLDFDEYFKLTNQFQEFVVFPPDKIPDYKVRGKSLIIELKDTLQKNTTYVINFGKGLVDVNEGNVLKNFTYVFATGDHIDSLSISGTVTNNTTQLKEKDATVMLFTLKQDSLLFGKKKPSLFTTTDSAGNFTLSNLREGMYRIYALKETAPDKIYNNDNDLIAFTSNAINLTKDTSNVALKLFKQSPTKLRLVDRKFNQDGSLFFSVNRPLIRPTVKILYPAGLDAQKITEFAPTSDTVNLYSKNMDFDSIQVAFFEDGKPVDTTSLRKGRKETFTRNLSFKYGVSIMSELKPGNDLKLYANLPIETFEQGLITLKEDSNNVAFTLTKDTGTTKRYTIKHRWRQKAKYVLTIGESAFTSIYGDKSKSKAEPSILQPRKLQQPKLDHECA
ncbi:Ig-like domain-containing protein [Mucilaginibacter antarcticus]|uniref:Ig-like domain-containing protein n=1 Tax=Mucilaginibacter antarcticus TaxID=1855725 RepID=UPI0036386222